MTLLGLRLTQLLLLFAATAAAVTLLYLFRLHPRRVTVPFAALWVQALTQRQSRTLWRRLRRLFSLLIQLLFVLLLVAALGDPQLSDRLLTGRHIVLLLDASASMRATDAPEGTRMQAALVRARQVVRAMRGRDRIMIVRMDHRVLPLTPFTGDVKGLLAALTTVDAAQTPGDMAGALHFCLDALRGQREPRLIVIGDGSYDPTLFTPLLGKQAAADLRFITVGRSVDNVGIVAFSARRDPLDRTSLALFLELVNYQDRPASLDVHLLADGGLVDVRHLDLAARQHARYSCDTREQGVSRSPDWCGIRAVGQVLEARLVRRSSSAVTTPAASSSPKAAPDVFDLDDHAFAVIPPRRVVRLLLVTAGNLFLEAALLPLENVELQRVRPNELTADLARRFDVIVLDGAKTPPENLSTNLIWIAPPEMKTRSARARTLVDPLITDQNTDHPVMRNITLKDVNMLEARQLVTKKGDVVLASSFRRPLMVARQQAKQRQVIIGFDVKRSDLPLRIAFPLLLANAIDWFSNEDEGGSPSVLRVGQTWRVPLAPLEFPAGDGSATVVFPDGRRSIVPVSDGRALIDGRQVGIYELRRKGKSLRLAGNLASVTESDIGAHAGKILQTRRLSPSGSLQRLLRRGLWLYLALASIGLSLLEWFTYNRRMTV